MTTLNPKAKAEADKLFLGLEKSGKRLVGLGLTVDGVVDAFETSLRNATAENRVGATLNQSAGVNNRGPKNS